jgi:hopanoid biosynthesis associated RND transporter like protein HpnN
MVAVAVVGWCWRHAVAVVAVALVATVLLGVYAATHLHLDTDESKLISSDLPFRRAEKQMDKAFPQGIDLLAVVLDAPTPEQAEQAVERLRAALEGQHELFRSVRRPEEELFFRKNGLLFLPVADLTELSDRLVQAQPLLGSVARDPSLRGLLGAVDLALEGVAHGKADIHDLEPLLGQLDKSAAVAATGGTPAPVSWQSLMGGEGRDAPRRFLLTQPVLQYEELTAGGAATDAVRDAARKLELTPEHGYRVRLTGSVALSDANFATVADGIGVSAALSLVAVLALLFLAVRSRRVVVAILISLLVGLVATAAFAAAAVGSLNPISVAFAVMFVGIAVDFAIQFVIAYRNERFTLVKAEPAILSCASIMGAPLTLAAVATSVGFLSFLPTAYSGVSQLGLIAGGGMIIALVVDFTLLPALLALLKTPAEKEPVGLRLAAADGWLERHAQKVVGVAAGICAIGAVMLPVIPRDFNPLHLQDPKTEAVSTFLDLARDPDNGSYGIDILTPSQQAAVALADKLDALPEVARTMTLATFIPDGQDEKLAIVTDVAGLLGPTLTPPVMLPPPTTEELRAALMETAAKLETVAAGHEPSQRLAQDLRHTAETGPQATAALAQALGGNLPTLLDGLRNSLDVQALSLDTLPPEIVRQWVAKDGRARVQIQPKGDMQSEKQLNHFSRTVLEIAPNATGTPVSIQQSGKVVIEAFTKAGLMALLAIAVLLGLMLRRALDAMLVVAPLVTGALATVIAVKLGGLSINFANIIALPLLLGIGVAFNIYFVVNWRNGVTAHLQSPTTRAVLFSALTTGSAFGSLAVSPHLGTASMGLLLFISLALSVTATFVVLPALFHVLGKPKP